MAELFTGNTVGMTNVGVAPITDHNTTDAALTQNTIVSNGDRYTIDITGLVRKWRTEETPFLAIMDNLGGGSVSNPYHVWIDEYEGDSWVDIKLDDFRSANTKNNSFVSTTIPGYNSTLPSQPHEIDSDSYVGGSFTFIGLNPSSLSAFGTVKNISGVGNSTNVATAILAAIGNGHAITLPSAGTDRLIAFKSHASPSIIGSPVNVYNNLRQFASFLGYNVIEESATTATAITFGTTSKVPIYFAFDDIYVKDGTGVLHYEEALLRLEAVAYSNSVLYFVLNLTQSNIAGLANATKVLLANEAINGATDDSDFLGLVSHPSRMALIGLPIGNELPNPEGGKFAPGGNLNFGRERKENFVEIFRSPSYGITGTHQASKFRFGDDFARTRAMYMAQYKKRVNYKLLTGVKSEVPAINATDKFANGQPARSVGGLLDYALFPINYKKVKLAEAGSSNAETLWTNLRKFIDSIANGTFAFRNGQGSQNITLLASKAFLRRLSPYVSSAFSYSQGMGGQIQINQPSEVNFNIKSTSFVSTDGIRVNFVHEPALDYMINFPLAYHQFGVGSVRAQDILLNVDFQNVKKMTFRNDRIMGSIQDIGQDAFLEGITGDHTLELSFPKNHGVIYSPTV